MHMMQLLLDQVAQQQSSSSAGGGAAGSNAAGESLQQFRAQHLLDAVVSSQCWSCSWDGTDAFWGAELHVAHQLSIPQCTGWQTALLW
jgi:hypothetical protein